MAGQTGFGTTVTFNSVSLGQIVSVDGPSVSRAAVDVSSNSSTDMWMDQAPGMIDPGTISVECRYVQGVDPITHFGAAPGTTANLVIDWPGTGETYTQSAFMTGVSIASPHDGSNDVTYEFQGTGKPTFAA